MEIHLYKFLHRVATNKWAVAIKRGLLKVQPLILIACLLRILIYILTIISDQTLGFTKQIMLVINLIDKIISLMLAITISYSLADKSYKANKGINPIVVAATSLASISMLHSNNSLVDERILNILNSIIVIIFAIFSTEVILYLYKFQKKYLKRKVNNYERITNNFNSIIIPTIITVILCIIIKNFFIDNIIISMSKNSGINSVFKEVVLGQMLWFLGGHGGNIIYDNSPYLTFVVFSNLGGAGATLGLIIATYILNYRKAKKEIPRISIITSIFNINEPILYGLPIIFNPIYLIPFILVPLVSIYITIFANSIGMINFNSNNHNWIMPIFLNGYFLTGSFNGVIIQIINLVIGVIIYMPFVKLFNKINTIELKYNFESMKQLVFSNNIGETKLIERDDEIGDIAKILSVDLHNDLINKKELYLEYQPQVSKKGVVVGVEALLRWRHSTLGNIPPNIVILLAIELDIINELGKWIIDESCHQLSIFKEELDRDIEMSINVSSQQLSDSNLYNYIVKVISDYKVDFNNIKIEITETVPLGNDDITKEQIEKLNDLGIKFAIDDFGQGYNPILYLKKYNIDTVKLDGSLIKGIDTDDESRYIVGTMFDLCSKLSIKIVCEFVENEKQKLILDNMGDGIYQGYLFSKPLGGREVIEFIKENIRKNKGK